MHRFVRFYSLGSVTLPLLFVFASLVNVRGDEQPKSRQSSPPLATQMAEAQDVFLADPKSEEALEARRQMARLTELDEPDSALVKLVKLRKRDEKDGDGLDLAILHLAGRYIEREEYRPGTSLLKEIIDRYPPSSTTSRAMLMLADIYKSTKDQKASEEWLTRCVEFELTKASDQLFDPTNRNALSITDLANRCQENCSYLLSFKLWRAWSPTSDCGTCLWGMHDTRQARMKACLPHLEDHMYAVKCCVEDAALLRGDYAHSYLAGLYRDAGQLLDLARICGELEQRERNVLKDKDRDIDDFDTTSKFLRSAIAAENLRQQDNLAGVASLLADKSLSEGIKTYITDILAASGDDGVAVAESAMRDGKPNQHYYLLRALAANHSDRAFETLCRIARGDAKVGDTWCLVDCLAGRGEKGIEVVRELTSHSDRLRVKAAEEFLQRFDENKKRGVDLRSRANLESVAKLAKKPERGSLPKTLDEALKDSAK